MIPVAYRHGLGASEKCELTWDAIDFNAATMHVSRNKHGQAATHQIRGDELRALRKLHKEQEPKSAFVFTSERASSSRACCGLPWSRQRRAMFIAACKPPASDGSLSSWAVIVALLICAQLLARSLAQRCDGHVAGALLPRAPAPPSKRLPQKPRPHLRLIRRTT
jgi:Phage integrase family